MQKGKPIAINGGSISVLFDANRNVTVISYAKDKFGVGRAIGNPLLLNTPCGAEKLGAAVRTAMAACKDGIPCTDHMLMSKLAFKGWKEFSTGKRNISVHYAEGYGITFNTTRRNIDGAYQFNHRGFEKTADNRASNKELGEILLELLPRCRC